MTREPNLWGKRHDGVELILLLPPHEAARLPGTVASPLGRVDVQPSLHVPDNGKGFLLDVGEMRRLQDPRNITLPPHPEPDLYRDPVLYAFTLPRPKFQGYST